MGQLPFVSVVMPCLNEEKTVAICVRRAKSALKKANLKGEIIVSDNGSTDTSVKLAKAAGARIVRAKIRGYGSAYLAGIAAAKGDLIVIGDSDGTYNFQEIPHLTKPLLENSADLVIGSRFLGRLSENAMPKLNRYFGTPLLNLFLRIFYHLKLSDSQSGMRAFRKTIFNKLKMKTLGMEFASEMLVRASQLHLKITEIPISYSRRLAPAKLSRFRDAWRHIRFMLLFAPTYLFLIPGSLLMSIGLIGVFTLAHGPLALFNYYLDFHTMILCSLFTLVGYQIVMLGIFAKAFSWTEGLNQQSLVIATTYRYFQLEKGIVLGSAISLGGLVVGLVTFIQWTQTGFGPLSAIRPAIFSMTFLTLGIEIIFSSFFLSILGIEKKS